MLLAVHSDASYLSEPGSKSRAAGHHYLSKLNDEHFNNLAVLTLTKIIKHVMSSASEAETAALFYNCKAAAPLRIALEEMGHPQMKTQVTTNNNTARNTTACIDKPSSTTCDAMRGVMPLALQS